MVRIIVLTAQSSQASLLKSTFVNAKILISSYKISSFAFDGFGAKILRDDCVLNRRAYQMMIGVDLFFIRLFYLKVS